MAKKQQSNEPQSAALQAADEEDRLLQEEQDRQEEEATRRAEEEEKRYQQRVKAAQSIAKSKEGFIEIPEGDDSKNDPFEDLEQQGFAYCETEQIGKGGLYVYKRWYLTGKANAELLGPNAG